MKKTLKKISAIVISIALLMTFAPSVMAISSTPSKTKIAPYSKTVTITAGRILNRGQQYAKGESGTKNAYLDLIKKKVNVQIKIVWETIPQQYNQKLALCIAGGNIPDTFMIQNDNMLTFRALVEGNQLADLTSAYNKSIGGQTANLLKSVDTKEVLKYMTINNKIYGITQPGNGYNYDMLWVRNDWLKKLNLAVPKTLEDIKNVAKAFIENKPGGQDNTIGLAINPQDPINRSDGFYSASPVANSVGSFPKSWIKGKDGKVIYGSVAPETKTALGILANWYKEGILDKSFMTLKNIDEVTPYVNNSQCGMFFGGWWSPWPLADMVKKNPSIEWIPVLAPLNAQGKYLHTNPLSSPGGQVVSKKCKNPEAVIKAMNVLDEAETFRSYDNDPAVVKMLKPERDAGAGGRTISPFGASLANNFYGVLDDAKLVNSYIKTGTVKYNALTVKNKDYIEGAYQYTKKKDLTVLFQYVGHYGFNLAGNLALSPVNVDVPDVFMGDTESMGDLWPAMKSLEEQTFVQIISNEKPLSYFDDFVKQWKKAGGDIITKEVQAAVGK
jgi:putative aldouronate transport system substrate-binding protein